ncbi:hypothetical protein GWK47_050405 [Chionoecetes opilio]|uniref:Uncharacterized protein n=1 Tax=Chionoecetes opilio TaxID=41210 RepID=A0A8J5CEC6_CHIOP|nr:hypothetical protein GWK47_050405 [Chionoecetes opilio]
MARKWSNLSGDAHQCTPHHGGFRRWFQSASASQRSCRAMGERNLTSQESRGFLGHLGVWRAEEGGSQVCQEVAYAAKHWPENGSLGHRRRCMGPSLQYLNTPPQGSEASPAQLITGTSAAGTPYLWGRGRSMR